jgi:hypothetical protein
MTTTAAGLPSSARRPNVRHRTACRSGVLGLADLWTFDEPCATWPVRGQDTYNGQWNARTSPILVIGNTTDPFLPLRDAIAMTRQLADAAAGRPRLRPYRIPQPEHLRQ